MSRIEIETEIMIEKIVAPTVATVAAIEREKTEKEIMTGIAKSEEGEK